MDKISIHVTNTTNDWINKFFRKGYC